ncbi:MAG TPA: LysM peptidoglycan-binding domain-containing protein [Chloroflexota bacterium]|nr:LysM peptidoglycan-binding domain-containing protein [Chloroflexota bacterium]
MQEYVPAPERRYPSPSAQRRSGEHWKARVGLGFVIILTLCSAAVMFRIAGMGVGSATSVLRGPVVATPAPRQAAAATAPAAAGQPQPGSQPVATQAPAAPAAQPTSAAAQPTAAATPSARPGQREHIVAGGDNLSAIATRYGTTIDAIVAANNLSSRTVTLNIGQRLVIPG